MTEEDLIELLSGPPQRGWWHDPETGVTVSVEGRAIAEVDNTPLVIARRPISGVTWAVPLDQFRARFREGLRGESRE